MAENPVVTIEMDDVVISIGDVYDLPADGGNTAGVVDYIYPGSHSIHIIWRKSKASYSAGCVVS
jgi:hypothetical protein